MGSFISKLFSKVEVVDVEKLKIQANLSFERSQFDKQLFLTMSFSKLRDDAYEAFVVRCLQIEPFQKVSLSEEVEKLKEYIQFVHKSSSSPFFYKIDVKGVEIDSVLIAPFTLLPLITNALYKGYNSLEKFPIRIRVNLSHSMLKLEVSNRVNHNLIDQEANEELNCFKARLNVLYPDKHNLIFNSNTNLFKATLILDLS